MSAVQTEERVTCRPAVIPYYLERANFPPDILQKLYRKMVEQGLDREVWHDRAMTEDEAVNFLDKDVLLSILLDLNGSYVGFAYVSNTEETDTLKKGLISFCVFKEYWHPRVTELFAQIYLGQLFNVLQYTTLCQITPAPNRLARRYAARTGFKVVATIPRFVSYHHETVDAVLGILTKERFNSGERT